MKKHVKVFELFDNWTPSRTGRGKAFECFLSCRVGHSVRLQFRPIRVQYSNNNQRCTIIGLNGGVPLPFVQI